MAVRVLGIWPNGQTSATPIAIACANTTYIMPPMPPMSGMPPPHRRAFFGGLVGDHGFGRDQQTGDRGRVFQRGADTLAGSMTPNLNMSPYSSVCALKPKLTSTIRGSCPQQPSRQRPRFRRSDAAVLRARCARWRCRRSDRSCRLSDRPALCRLDQSNTATNDDRLPAPQHGSRSARHRHGPCALSLRSSVMPPTRMTATPPASLATRSCSFSRS